MKRLLAFAFAGALAATAVAAQTPPPQQPTPRAPTRAETPPREADKVTVQGCLMREADVPGRKPNIAERAGITEDYILTSTKILKGAPPATSTGKPVTSSSMFEVEGLTEDRLKPHLGRRVEIDGTFQNLDAAGKTGMTPGTGAARTPPTTSDPAGAPSTPPAARTMGDDLIELRAQAIRQVAGECPMTR